MVTLQVENPDRTEKTLTSADTQTPAPQKIWVRVLRRGYVPLMSLLLTALVGHWLAGIAERNVEQKAEERSERQTVASVPGLSAADLAETQFVLNPNDAPAMRTQLLYLGDSQVFSRPDAPPGALNTAQWLQVLLSRQDDHAVRVRIGASPGTDIPEMLLKAVAASEQNPRRDDIIVADLALAEFRDLGVRSEIQAAADPPVVNSDLKSLVSGNPDLADANKMLSPVLSAQQQGPSEKKAAPSLADRMEDTLQRKADKWSLFQQRENLIGLGLLRYAQWEHRLLHISSDTRIPTHAAPYRTNLQLLELLMRYARDRNIHLVLFFGPVRDLEPNPDAPADLARMHRDVGSLCERYAVTCLDYSHAVPESLWADYAANQRGAFAMMAGQHDFYHFTEAAHKSLAEKLVSDAGAQILQWSTQAGAAQ